jgi:ribosomal protein S26
MNFCYKNISNRLFILIIMMNINVEKERSTYYCQSIAPIESTSNTNRKEKDGQDEIIKDYILWSIINLIFCCIIAVFAIMFSIRSREKMKTKDYIKAEEYSFIAYSKYFFFI